MNDFVPCYHDGDNLVWVNKSKVITISEGKKEGYICLTLDTTGHKPTHLEVRKPKDDDDTGDELGKDKNYHDSTWFANSEDWG